MLSNISLSHRGSRAKPLSLRGRFPHSVGKMSRSDKRGRAVSRVVGKYNFDNICLAFRLDLIPRKAFSTILNQQHKGGESNLPLKVNLSALSCVGEKKGRACHGMSDKSIIFAFFNLLKNINKRYTVLN